MPISYNHIKATYSLQEFLKLWYNTRNETPMVYYKDRDTDYKVQNHRTVIPTY